MEPVECAAGLQGSSHQPVGRLRAVPAARSTALASAAVPACQSCSAAGATRKGGQAGRQTCHAVRPRHSCPACHTQPAAASCYRLATVHPNRALPRVSTAVIQSWSGQSSFPVTELCVSNCHALTCGFATSSCWQRGPTSSSKKCSAAKAVRPSSGCTMNERPWRGSAAGKAANRHPPLSATIDAVLKLFELALACVSRCTVRQGPRLLVR